MKRVVTALLLIPFFCYIVLWAPQWAFLVTVAAVAVLCFREYSELAALHGIAKPGLFGYVAGLLLLLLPGKDGAFFVLIAILGDVARAAVARNGASAAGRSGAAAREWRMFLDRCAAASNCAPSVRTGSFLRCRSTGWATSPLFMWDGVFGRHKLAPNVSPAKSWEGSIASTVARSFMARSIFRWLLPAAPLAEALGLTVIANIAGQFGDLCESAIKRGAGVKDSGNLLPGHGGWLDRLDSSLFALPVVYFVVSNFGW